MKSILKTKILVILLVLISINFIYPGCCKKKTGNGGNKSGGGDKSSSKTNSTGKKKNKGGIPVKKPKDTSMPVDSATTKPGVKKGKLVPPSKPVASKPTVTKPSSADIVNAILVYMNARVENRSDLAKLWGVNIIGDMSCIITNGYFTGTIAKEKIEAITNPNDDTIKDLEVTIKITRPDGTTEYKFDNNKCTLENLRKSLNVLEKKHRNDYNEEYLYVYDSNGQIYETCYINLNRGLLYTEDSDGYFARVSNIKGKNKMYSKTLDPYYLDKKYYEWDNDDKKFNEYEDDKNPRDKFIEPLFKNKQIGKFKFVINTYK